MPDLVANVAVIGRVQLMPGMLPVRLEDPTIDCLVAHAFPNHMEDPKRGIKIDTSDCTVFTVTHRDRGDLDLANLANVRVVFEQSLSAISEVSIWTKAGDVVGDMTAFIRQIGTTDVKAFFAQGAGEALVGWFSPAFTFDRDAAAMMAGFLSNMIVSNGPAVDPVPAITRRVMSSLGLINLGFHTESFVNMFSLVDDLTQEVIKAGMTERGLNEDEQTGLLRAIKEERLKVYLCNLAKLCGWQSLEETKKDLYDRVSKVNATRNRIMHGSRRLTSAETIENVDVLLALIDWLRSNPFGFLIPNFPVLRIAEPHFSLVPLKPSDPNSDAQSRRSEPPDRGA
jgi:hypothetical protein